MTSSSVSIPETCPFRLALTWKCFVGNYCIVALQSDVIVMMAVRERR